MKIKIAIVAVILVAAAAAAGHLVLAEPVQAQTDPTAEDLRSELDLVDELLFLPFATWVSQYDANRKSSRYQRFDWSQDHCSLPLNLDPSYAELFRMACLRHDFMWRTLAVVDQATGRVWNERNRYRADRQIERDAHASCRDKFEGAAEAVLLMACEGVASRAYDLIRIGAGYRRTLMGYEEPSVDNILHGEYRSGMKVMPNEDCSHAGNSDNRCLPIH